jgi:spore maturation protein CgeB
MSETGAPLRIAIFGLSITSAWGNGHATTYRALVRALARRGHHVTFYEREQPWYAANRDLARPDYCNVVLYDGVKALEKRVRGALPADVVIVGSYVPEGVHVAEWALTRANGPVLFYDIDTPVTLARLARGDCPYLSPHLVPEFDQYLSFTGGPILERLQRQYGARRPRPFYCSVDADHYFPDDSSKLYDLGYLGTYSDDRQPKLEMLLNEPARHCGEARFCVAGAQYPRELSWPDNVERIEHFPPHAHRKFYNAQRFTLNVTRRDMVESGYSPSVRLFEAAACGTPIISDAWAGLEDFFVPGQEILLARSSADVMHYLRDLSLDEARAIGLRARARVLCSHTADHRARELEGHIHALEAKTSSEASPEERICHAS